MNRRNLLAFFTIGAAGTAATASSAEMMKDVADAGKRMAIKDGDTIILSFPGNITQAQMNQLRENCKKAFKSEMGVNVGVIVLASGLEMSVIPRA